MADIVPTKTALSQRALMYLWETLTNANTAGKPVDGVLLADKTIQIVGTFDSATVVIEGSNDGTNYETLTDIHSNAMSYTAADMAVISEAPRYVRPNTTGGGGSQDVDVYMCSRAEPKGR